MSADVASSCKKARDVLVIDWSKLAGDFLYFLWVCTDGMTEYMHNRTLAFDFTKKEA